MESTKQQKRTQGTTLLTIQPPVVGTTTVTELEGPIAQRPARRKRRTSHVLQSNSIAQTKTQGTTLLAIKPLCSGDTTVTTLEGPIPESPSTRHKRTTSHFLRHAASLGVKRRRASGKQ